MELRPSEPSSMACPVTRTAIWIFGKSIALNLVAVADPEYPILEIRRNSPSSEIAKYSKNQILFLA